MLHEADYQLQRVIRDDRHAELRRRAYVARVARDARRERRRLRRAQRARPEQRPLRVPQLAATPPPA